MKKLITLLIFILISIGAYSQSGLSTFKYEVRVPSLRVGGATKVKLDSIVQNVDTIKFYNGGTELKSNGAGIWTGTGIRLDTTLARVTLGIDQVPNLSLAAMFNEPTFTSITRVVDGILPTVSGASYLGSTSYQWGNLYLRSGSTLNWDDGNVLLTAGGGKLDLLGADLDLHYGDLLTYGNIGSNAFNVNYGYFDSLYVANPIIGNLYGLSEQTRGFYPTGGRLVLSGADSLTVITTGQTTVTLPTSGTLLTTAVLSGYAPLSAPAFTDDLTVEYIRPATSTGVALGNPAYPWANLHMSSTAGVIWDASTDIILAPAAGDLRLVNSAFLIDDNDIGLNTYPVRKGYFTDLDIANDLALTGSINITGASISNTELAALDGVTGNLNYSTENYGATGTGDIVLSIGPTLTTVNITDVIKLTPMDSPPAGATEGMIYADTDHHLYYYDGSTWVSMTD